MGEEADLDWVPLSRPRDKDVGAHVLLGGYQQYGRESRKGRQEIL